MSEADLSTLLDLVPDAMFVVGPDGRITQANDLACALSGYRRAELIGLDVDRLVPERTRSLHARHRANYLARPQVRPMGAMANLTLLRKDGTEVPVDIRLGFLARDGARLAIATVRDITAAREAERRLKESEERFRGLTELSADWYWEQDREFRFTFLSSAASDTTRLPLDQMIGKTRFELPLQFESEEAKQAHRHTLLAHEPFRDLELRSPSTGGWFSVSGTPVFGSDGAFCGYRGVARDITEAKRVAERNETLATRDALTGLPNRTLLADRLQMALFDSARSRLRVAVLFIDLDHFKYVNDTLGHAAGDSMLRQVSERLGRLIRKGDTLGRLGGDEFVMILHGLAQPADVEPVAEKIIAAVREPFSVAGQVFVIGASVGIATSPIDGSDPATLMKHADMAMYEAKSQGRGRFRFYSEEINRQISARVSLEQDLREALQNDRLRPFFQPKMCATTGELVGAEALLRWDHPRKGIVAPAEFIRAAEECGLIVAIGERVFQKVCRAIGDWLGAGYEVPRVAVNVSAHQLATGHRLIEHLEAVMAQHSIGADRLELEITESALIPEKEGPGDAILKDLVARGARISIDDFGTGFSSLSYLRYLPIQSLKIDRSFVRDIVTSADSAAIVEAILAIARALRLSVTAEGVETVSQRDLLQRLGCHVFQGYLISPAVPAEEFGERFLRKSKSPVTRPRAWP